MSQSTRAVANNIAVERDVAEVQNELLKIPDDFLCPITLEVMRDPVCAADGHSYERAAIQEWLIGHRSSPKTGAPLAHTTLTPTHTLRQVIESVMEKMPIIQRHDIEQRQRELDLKKIMEIREIDLQALEEKHTQSMIMMRNANKLNQNSFPITFFGSNNGISRRLAIKILNQIDPNPLSVNELQRYLHLPCISKSWHALFNEGMLVAKRDAVRKKLLHLLSIGDLKVAQSLMRGDVEIKPIMLTNVLRSMNLELIKVIYEKLGSDLRIMERCIEKLPHRPMIPYKHGKLAHPENTVFYHSWVTLSAILADKTNFEAQVYISDWLWERNGSNPNWIMSITNVSGHIQVMNRKGEIVEKLSLDNRCGPSALKYRIPLYVTNCYIEQIRQAVKACYDCCTYIEEQMAAKDVMKITQ
jgi:hypothetical protein